MRKSQSKSSRMPARQVMACGNPKPSQAACPPGKSWHAGIPKQIKPHARPARCGMRKSKTNSSCMPARHIMACENLKANQAACSPGRSRHAEIPNQVKPHARPSNHGMRKSQSKSSRMPTRQVMACENPKASQAACPRGKSWQKETKVWSNRGD